MPRRGSRRECGGGAEAPVDAALLEEWALSYLARYASTAENLRRVLRRRVSRRLSAGGSLRIEGNGQDESSGSVDLLIDALVARYREAELLDDAAYAAGRARRGQGMGRSLRRIAAGLAAKGVNAADAEAAIAELRGGADDPDLAAACAFARRRRLGPFRSGAAERKRELAAFARAGFGRRTAEAVLACPDEAAIAALLDEQQSG